MSTWTFLRLCVRAPLMRIDSMGRPANIQQPSLARTRRMTGADPTAQRLATAAFGLLLLAAFPAYFAFDAHPGLAGLGDDSVSYVIQAQLYAGTAGDAVR